jgi:hypothetical protein
MNLSRKARLNDKIEIKPQRETPSICDKKSKS